MWLFECGQPGNEKAVSVCIWTYIFQNKCVEDLSKCYSGLWSSKYSEIENYKSIRRPKGNEYYLSKNQDNHILNGMFNIKWVLMFLLKFYSALNWNTWEKKECSIVTL